VAGPFVQFVGKDHSLQIGGVKLLGIDSANLHKLLFTVIFFCFLYLVNRLLRYLAEKAGAHRERTAFWSRQGISIVIFIIGILGFLSIWFDNPTRLATGIGLVIAGLAFAMQKVVTSFAGYIVILRGKTFNVGDRISMGNVRGDVIALNFIQTVIMEMGEPPAVQNEDPGMWVQSRQYSGRIVTISNAEIFEKPVYNYTRDFPYIWEEMHIPISYKDDHHRAEQIMIESVSRHTTEVANMAQPELDHLKQRFFIQAADIRPRVFLRLTDNWIELAVRFLCSTHDIRDLKNKISRDILAGLEEANIGIASSTYDIVGLPPIRIENPPANASGPTLTPCPSISTNPPHSAPHPT
jgi:small-conductance mechanosensitive channel